MMNEGYSILRRATVTDVDDIQMHDTPLIEKRRSSADTRTRRPRIAFIIPRGEVIRNFVHSGALDQIKAAADVTLLTVTPKNSYHLLARTVDDIHPLKQISERRIIRILREILDMAHGRWLWSGAAQFRWRSHDQDARTVRQKTIRLVKKLVSLPFSTRTGLNVLSRIERSLSYRLRTTNDYLDLMREIAPDIVFNGSHIHSRNATQAIQAAQWLGISTATFIFSWDNLTSQGRIILPYDHYLIWSDGLKRQLLNMYRSIKPENVHVTGTPQFDFHFRKDNYCSREEFCEKFSVDPNRRIVLYTTGMANHMPDEPEIVEELGDMMLEYPAGSRPQLLVRVYPKDTTGRFNELKERRTDIRFLPVSWEEEWLTPEASDSSDLVNTLRHCDVGINVASTVSLELCMFDKPVINVAYNPRSVDERTVSFLEYYDFDHYAPVVASGAVEIARDRDEMRRLISSALEDPSRLSAQRNSLIKKMFEEKLDGKSAQRVSEVLIRLASNAGRR